MAKTSHGGTRTPMERMTIVLPTYAKHQFDTRGRRDWITVRCDIRHNRQLRRLDARHRWAFLVLVTLADKSGVVPGMTYRDLAFEFGMVNHRAAEAAITALEAEELILVDRTGASRTQVELKSAELEQSDGHAVTADAPAPIVNDLPITAPEPEQVELKSAELADWIDDGDIPPFDTFGPTTTVDDDAESDPSKSAELAEQVGSKSEASRTQVELKSAELEQSAYGATAWPPITKDENQRDTTHPSEVTHQEAPVGGGGESVDLSTTDQSGPDAATLAFDKRATVARCMLMDAAGDTLALAMLDLLAIRAEGQANPAAMVLRWTEELLAQAERCTGAPRLFVEAVTAALDACEGTGALYPVKYINAALNGRDIPAAVKSAKPHKPVITTGATTRKKEPPIDKAAAIGNCMAVRDNPGKYTDDQKVKVLTDVYPWHGDYARKLAAEWGVTLPIADAQ